jgi:tetrapyrrole methylase family protein/MazG family protein
MPQERAAAFEKLYDVVSRLRGDGGCPWDREQTPMSLRGDLIEETYECIEAIDEQDPAHIKEELGDIFLLVFMISFMHEEQGLFSIKEVVENLCDKLIRRHPHVFAQKSKDLFEDPQTLSPQEALQTWAKMKIEQEGRKPKDSILDEVRRGLPPLDRAFKLQKKAAKAGFDWPDAGGVLAKLREELAETESAICAFNSGAKNGELEGELGDLLFSVVNLCRFFDVEPSLALNKTNLKFIERFAYVEKRMKENGQEMKAGSLALMDSYWNEAKKS